ncbi:hypothetical protein AgCh_015710 [Apium graveolens]
MVWKLVNNTLNKLFDMVWELVMLRNELGILQKTSCCPIHINLEEAEVEIIDAGGNNVEDNIAVEQEIENDVDKVISNIQTDEPAREPEIENDAEQMIINVQTDVPAGGEVVYNSDDDFVNPAPWSKKKNEAWESKKVNKRHAVKGGNDEKQRKKQRGNCGNDIEKKKLRIIDEKTDEDVPGQQKIVNNEAEMKGKMRILKNGNVKGKPERRIANGKIEQRTEIAKKDDDIAKIRNSLRGDIEITEQAVHDVIGLPCGGAEIEFGNDEMISERIDNWRSQLPVTEGQSFVKACEVVDRIKQTGEIMYVDRVCFQGKKLVLRLYPAFRGWTKEKLKEREVMEAEDNAFSSGVILNLATIEELEENERLFWKRKAYTENEEEVPENENEDT